MNYEILTSEIEKTAAPLAERVAQLRADITGLARRAEIEQGSLEQCEVDLAKLKEAATENLGDNGADFEKFKNSIKRTQARRDAAQAGVMLLTSEILPAKRKEFSAARTRLTSEIMAWYTTTKATCEAELSRLLAQVIVEHDRCLSGVAQVCRDYGVSLSIGSMTCPRPAASSERLGAVHHHMTRPKTLELTAPPAPTTSKLLKSPEPAAPDAPTVNTDAPGASLNLLQIDGIENHTLTLLTGITMSTEAAELTPPDMDADTSSGAAPAPVGDTGKGGPTDELAE
jgi:hypothetical protein